MAAKTPSSPARALQLCQLSTAVRLTADPRSLNTAESAGFNTSCALMRCCGCMQARSMLLEALYCSCLLTVPRTTVPGDESAATRQTPDGKPPKHSKAMQQMCSVTLRPSISRYSVYIQTPFAKQTPAKSPHRRLNAPNTNRRAFKLPDRREHSRCVDGNLKASHYSLRGF